MEDKEKIKQQIAEHYRFGELKAQIKNHNMNKKQFIQEFHKKRFGVELQENTGWIEDLLSAYVRSKANCECCDGLRKIEEITFTGCIVCGKPI